MLNTLKSSSQDRRQPSSGRAQLLLRRRPPSLPTRDNTSTSCQTKGHRGGLGGEHMPPFRRPPHAAGSVGGHLLSSTERSLLLRSTSGWRIKCCPTRVSFVEGAIGKTERWVTQMEVSSQDCLKFESVPLVFRSDDDGPVRKHVNVVVSPGSLTCQHSAAYGHGSVEHTFSFFLCDLPSVLFFPRSWFAASFARPLPIRPKDLALRHLPPKRNRLTVSPPWPLDFVVHLYDSADCEVQTIMERFLCNAGQPCSCQ